MADEPQVVPPTADPAVPAEPPASAPVDVNEDPSPQETPQSPADAIEAALREESGEPDVPEPTAPEPEPSPEPPVTPEAEKDPPAEPDLDELYKTPDGLQDKSKERFESLVRDNKSVRADFEEQTKTYTQMTEYVQQIQTAIDETKGTADDFGNMLGYMKLSNSTNIEDNREALRLLHKEVEKLTAITGDTPAGDNPLDNHPDLQSEVDEMTMTEAHAKELATLRNQQKASESREAKTNQAVEAQQSKQSELDTAATDVKALVDEWKSTDIDFEAKHAILLDMAPDIKATYPPSQWAAALKQSWAAIGKGVSLKKKEAAPAPEPTAPLKSASTSAAGDKVPDNVVDAVEQALSGG